MSEDLKTLLQETAGKRVQSAADFLSFHENEPTGQASDTVLALDKWGKRRGADLAEEWKGLGPVICDGLTTADIESHVAADAHGALFEADPQHAANPADANRAAWFKQMMETPEYRALHNQTMLDADMSALAAKQICDEYTSYVAEQPEPKPGDPGPGSDGESVGTQIGRIRSAGKALKAAQQDVDDMKNVCDGLGGSGPTGGMLDRAEIAKAFKRVRNSDLLRQVMQLAGRMRARCRSLQKQKLHATSGEITGIELGGDMERLVDEELLALTGALGEGAQDVAEMNLLQRRSLCYKHKLNTPVQSGPLVISIDESGSMQGEKIIAAKALALTLAWLAGQQNRWCALVGFSGKSGEDVEIHHVAFPPGKREPDKLIEWVEHFFGGGTDFDSPCKTVPEELWPKWLAAGLKRGKTDHVIISDAIVEMTEERVAKYKAWSKAEQVRNFGILIGSDEPGYLGTISDRCWCLPELTLETKAVEEVLSI